MSHLLPRFLILVMSIFSSPMECISLPKIATPQKQQPAILQQKTIFQNKKKDKSDKPLNIKITRSRLMFLVAAGIFLYAGYWHPFTQADSPIVNKASAKLVRDTLSKVGGSIAVLGAAMTYLETEDKKSNK